MEKMKQFFNLCGTVVECTINESRHFAYIEYSKPEEEIVALALNNMDVGVRPMNVEMAEERGRRTRAAKTSGKGGRHRECRGQGKGRRTGR